MKPATGPISGERPTQGDRPKLLNSDALFGASNEVIIDHRGQAYRLRITTLGKLILTK